jgi:hypothetical protein
MIKQCFGNTSWLMMAVAGLIASCGGGGGSSPTPTPPLVSYSLSFNPKPLLGTTAVGFAHVATATIDKAIATKVNVAIVDKSGVLQAGVAPVITPNSTLSYTAQLTTSNTLAKGSYSGNLEVRICNDDPAVCAQPVNGSPWQLPYQFIVQDGLIGTTLPLSSTVLPTPASANLSECMYPSLGLISYLSNNTSSRREWVTGASFLGQTGLHARNSYDTNGKLSQTRYVKFDTANNLYSIFGYESFDVSTGAVISRIQYLNYSYPTNLSIGQSSTSSFTTKTLLPAGIADANLQETMSYLANENVSVAGADPNQPLLFLPTCKVSFSRAGVYNEIDYYSPGTSIVKAYFTNFTTGAADQNQTSLSLELKSSTASLISVSPPSFTSQPTLAQCSALPTRLVQTFTNQSVGSITKRTVATGNFEAASSLAQTRSTNKDVVLSIHHFDPVVGHFRRLGVVNNDATGTYANTITYNNFPDLTITPLGQTVTYTVNTSTVTAANPTTPTLSSTIGTMTNLGVEPVITPAGTFNACRVRFSNTGGDEIDHFVPNHGWVKATFKATGANNFTTYELIAEQ